MNIWGTRGYTGEVFVSFFLSLVHSYTSPSHVSLFYFSWCFEFFLCLTTHTHTPTSTVPSNLLSPLLPFNSIISLSRNFPHLYTPWPFFASPCVLVISSRLLSSPSTFQLVHLPFHAPIASSSLSYFFPLLLKLFPLHFIMAPHSFSHSTAVSSQNLKNHKSGPTPGSGSPGDT